MREIKAKYNTQQNEQVYSLVYVQVKYLQVFPTLATDSGMMYTSMYTY